MRLRTIMLTVAIIAVAGAALFLFTSGRLPAVSSVVGGEVTKHARPPHVTLEDTIFTALRRMAVPDSAVSVRRGVTSVDIRASIPRGEPIEVVIDRFSDAISATPYRVEDCSCTEGKQCALRCTSAVAGEPVVNITLRRSMHYSPNSARIFLVITDFAAARSDLAEEFADFPAPLAFAIVPSPSSAKLARRIAHLKDKSVLILLPMEPAWNLRRENLKMRIMIDYPDTRLRSLIHTAFSEVPGSTGLINLGGERALGDSRVMQILFAEMKGRHATFIEQAAPRKSVAADLAQQLRIQYAPANRRIDSTVSESEACRLLEHYADEAQSKGSVLVVGAATESLLNALRSEMPNLKKNGVNLAPLGSLFTSARDEE